MGIDQSIYFSIIVPTLNEANNIPLLLARIDQIFKTHHHFEVIIVDDDSLDGTKTIMGKMIEQYPWLHYIHRHTCKGLSTAIMEGFTQANYPYWVVMDADLSHPPESIPVMLQALNNQNVDLVIGSRFINGGSSDEALALHRRFISWIAASMARLVLSIPIKDPLSGFIAIKKSKYVAGSPITPIGWKIGLEIIIKCACKNIIEVPIHFAKRTHGYSKLNFKTAYDYLRHLFKLAAFNFSSYRKPKNTNL